MSKKNHSVKDFGSSLILPGSFPHDSTGEFSRENTSGEPMVLLDVSKVLKKKK
jgi:hypothetical protein